MDTLEQASQLAQDIKISLRSFTERRVIPKIGVQLNPNTHITRDSKNKYVIGESSRCAKGSQYFKCQGYSHAAAQCPSRNLLLKKVDDDEIEIVIHEATGSVIDFNDDLRVASIQ